MKNNLKDGFVTIQDIFSIENITTDTFYINSVKSADNVNQLKIHAFDKVWNADPTMINITQNGLNGWTDTQLTSAGIYYLFAVFDDNLTNITGFVVSQSEITTYSTNNKRLDVWINVNASVEITSITTSSNCANNITLDTTNFNHLLSSSDSTVQQAFETLDEVFNYVEPSIGLYDASSGATFSHYTNSTTGITATDGFSVGIDASEKANIWNYENTEMVFGTNNTKRVSITNDGKVGIGNITPASRLQVYESGSDSVISLVNNITGTTVNDGLRLGINTSSEAYLINRENGMMFFSTNNTARAYITAAGNVCIGANSTPPYKLSVYDSTNPSVACYTQTVNYATGKLSTDGLLVGIDASGNAIINQQENLDMVFSTNNTTRATLSAAGLLTLGFGLTVDGATVFNEASADVDFRIEGNGDADLFFVDASTDYVGIGTATPAHKLEVSKAGDCRILIRNSTESVNEVTYLEFMTGSGAPGVTNITGAIGTLITQATPSSLIADMPFYTNSGDAVAERMRLTGLGVLAITNAITAPSAEVANKIQVFSVDSSDATATLGLYLEQDVEAVGAGFTTSHKVKVKINGTEYWLALDAV